MVHGEGFVEDETGKINWGKTASGFNSQIRKYRFDPEQYEHLKGFSMIVDPGLFIFRW